MGNAVIYRPAYDAEVEYLEFPENYRPYIMTPIHSQQDLIITCKFKLGRTDNGQIIFGCLSNYNDGQMVYNSLSYFGVVKNVWHSYMFTNASSNISPDTEVHTLIFDVEHGDTYLDGILIKHLTIGTIETSIHYYTLGLMIQNEAGSVSGYCKNLRLYSWSVSKNGTTLMDLIPVRVGQIGYMYDKVTKQLFANKGTGNFILGNDVSNAVIPQQRCVLYSPMYDSQVEYLESTGTQYIDTGISYLQDKSISCYVRVNVLPTGSDWGCIIGCETSSNTWNFRLYVVRSKNQIGLKQNANDTDTLELDKFINVNVPSSMDYITIDGTNFPTDNWTFKGIATYMPLYLFALNRGNVVASLSNMRISSAKIWSQGVLVRDFIPVRIGSVGYLYDKVSKQLFANKGTGNFILGNDVSNAVIPQQRSVGFERIYEEYEWLKGDGEAYIDTNVTLLSDFVSVRFKRQLDVGGDILGRNRIDTSGSDFSERFVIQLIPASQNLYFYGNNHSYIHLDSDDNIAFANLSTDTASVNNQNSITVDFANNVDAFSIYVFAAHNRNGASSPKHSQEIGNVIISDVMNLVPCKLLQSIPAILDGNGIARQAGECGMWDKVSNKFYGNVANSGSFTVSND